VSSEHPRVRGKSRAHRGPYPFGEFPDDVIIAIGKQIVHRLAIGHADISGEDWGGIFANAISGEHLGSPIGLTDIIYNSSSSWSAKTVQCPRPFTTPSIRLISGRCSPDYSYAISDPRADVARTGEAVLSIWNERVARSKNDYDDLRVIVLIRNMSQLQFALFEYEPVRFTPGDYVWCIGSRNNLHADDKVSGERCFTWQPHGGQFTIHKTVPGSVCKFRIARHPGLIEPQQVLQLIRFKDSWIERIP